MIQEVQLDHAFADTLANSRDFQEWLLSGGRFARFAHSSKLLIHEQASARKSAKHWWKHWWCKLPDHSESETDIFLVFEADGARFAVHIENKPPHGQLGMEQAVDYRRRATFKANSPDWLNYSDFEVLLLAPKAFAHKNVECATQFDRTISYEQVGQFVPLFRYALAGA